VQIDKRLGYIGPSVNEKLQPLSMLRKRAEEEKERQHKIELV